ncbi:MAG TPA: hypothetical protein VI895_10725, partial [Bdellovibrionota bacterium]|nr:hypothetical protein [Bdellovibrionota bacterium]
AAKMGSANFGRRPMRPKEVGFLSVPPCPQCGAELVSNASNGSMDTAFKAAGIGGALIAYAFCAKYSCPEHGEIDSDHFPDAHRSALFRRRCAFIGSGIVVVLLCIKLVIWLQ